MNVQATQGKFVDARPLRTTSTNTAWDYAIAKRDAIAVTVRETLAREGLVALVIVSANGNYPPWVRVEAWLPVTSDGSDSARERAELTFVIDVKPYHEHTHVVSATLKRGKKSLVVKSRPDFSDAAIAEWLRYALGGKKKPSNYTPVRDSFQQLAHRVIWLIPEPHRNRVDRRLRNSLWQNHMGLLALFSLVLAGGGLAAVAQPGHEIALLFVGLGLAGLIAAGVVIHRRRRSISVIDQPAIPPRNLGLVDSWHAVVSQIGHDHDAMRQRVVSSIAQAASTAISGQVEVYGYRTPNGYEERDRLVLSKGQGQVHVHMYPFGDDMFVGWQAFLNWAQWAETVPVAQKIERGEEIEYRQLVSGPYIPNQFDLMDLNSLTELVHRRIEGELKAILREQAIDQQIDFKIIRGDRDRVLDKEQHKQGGYA